MKTRTKTICILFTLLFLMGCKKAPHYEIHENQTISACGINDPLQNIPWLKTYCSDHLKSVLTNISIYKNNTSDLNHIIIETSSNYEPDRSPSIIYTTSVYSCEGELLMFQGTEGATPVGWNAFFVENTRVAKIWEVKEIIEQ